MDDNVVVVQFDESSKAYQALSELNRLGREGRLNVNSAVLLERGEDGGVRVPEGADNAAGRWSVGSRDYLELPSSSLRRRADGSRWVAL